jgi:hypothetical protein
MNTNNNPHLIGRELEGIDRLEKRLDIRHAFHARKCVLEQRAQLIDGEEAHSARARLHVVSRHDEDALHADPVLGWAGLQLQAPGVEHPGTSLAADHLTLLPGHSKHKILIYALGGSKNNEI